MTKAEKIWLVIGMLVLAALILVEMNRVHKSIAAAQNKFGTPDSTNPIAPGQQTGPGQGQDAIAADVGPWYLYYNTPGVYAFGPPLVNTSMAPGMISNANTAQGGSVGSNCPTC